MYLVTLFTIVAVLTGIYFYACLTNPKYAENFQSNSQGTARCPNVLIQKGAKFYLHNTKIASVPGVNPIEFDNLEDYSEFLDWQRSQGIRCPVLYVQETYDAQGHKVFQTRPSVSEPQAGLPHMPQAGLPQRLGHETALGHMPQAGLPHMPNDLRIGDPKYDTLLVDATRSDPPYNKGSYPAFDQTSYYVGTTTPLDKMNMQKENQSVSPDPMDPNWGGVAYTQSLIDKGYYKGNEVKIAIE